MTFISDLRFAARMLAKNKGYTAVAVVALALGLGANIAIFSTVGLMIWPPLPYPDSKQLAWIVQTNARQGVRRASVSLGDARDWSAGSTIASIGVAQTRPLAISGEGEPQPLPAMQVSPEFLPALGVAPALGRAFTPAESPETDSRVAIISYELWQGMFRGEAGVLGRGIRLDGRNYTIVGVMPEGFHVLYRPADVIIPLALEAAERNDRSWRSLTAIARLKPGVTLGQADAEVRAISERVGREEPASGIEWRGAVRPLSERIVGRGGQAAARTMFGAVGFVLLIACANLAGLLLARGTLRRRELSVRAALGASRASLIRLQIAESVLLSLLGGVAGLISTIWSIPLLGTMAPPDMTLFKQAGLDWNALAFAFGLSLLTGVLFGAIPAWLLTRGDLAPAMQESSRGSTGGRHMILKALVAGEMALALVLLAAGTLMIRSLERQTRMDAGFDRRNLVAARVILPSARYPKPVEVTSFYSRVLETLRRDAGLESAALVETLPLGGDDNYAGVRLEGEKDAQQEKIVGFMVVSPGYFRTMRVPLLAGRDFTEADKADAAGVAVVNETFVKRYWPNVRDPAGRRIKTGGDKEPWLTVVGMARDVRHTNPYDPPRAEIYRPQAQTGSRAMTVVVRSRSGTPAGAAALRSAVWQVDRNQPLFRLESVEARFYSRRAGERATSQVLGLLAGLALVLAAVGTYGVIAYTAAQRAREIGIRMALGASRRDVFGMVLRGGLTLAVCGLAVGLPAALGVVPLLKAVDPGVESQDPATYCAVAVLLLLVALAASLAPARRAMRVDPVTVLRSE